MQKLKKEVRSRKLEFRISPPYNRTQMNADLKDSFFCFPIQLFDDSTIQLSFEESTFCFLNFNILFSQETKPDEILFKKVYE